MDWKRTLPLAGSASPVRSHVIRMGRVVSSYFFYIYIMLR